MYLKILRLHKDILSQISNNIQPRLRAANKNSSKIELASSAEVLAYRTTGQPYMEHRMEIIFVDVRTDQAMLVETRCRGEKCLNL